MIIVRVPQLAKPHALAPRRPLHHDLNPLFSACSKPFPPRSVITSSCLRERQAFLPSSPPLIPVPLENPNLLNPQHQHSSLFPLPTHSENTYLSPVSIVCAVLLPFSFSSRLIRMPAAESPMKRAKRGSRVRVRMCVGGILWGYGVLDGEVGGWDEKETHARWSLR